MIKQTEVHAIAHLTGGGFWENIPRVLPANTKAVIDESSWQWPAIFNWLQEKGNISRYEMYRTFNCGVGMVISLPEKEVETALALLRNKRAKKRGLSAKLNILAKAKHRLRFNNKNLNLNSALWADFYKEENEKIAVLISGQGTNPQTIIDACHLGDIPAKIACGK